MASTPTARFEHVWTALMRALAITHPRQLRANRALVKALHQRMGIR